MRSLNSPIQLLMPSSLEPYNYISKIWIYITKIRKYKGFVYSLLVLSFGLFTLFTKIWWRTSSQFQSSQDKCLKVKHHQSSQMLLTTLLSSLFFVFASTLQDFHCISNNDKWQRGWMAWRSWANIEPSNPIKLVELNQFQFLKIRSNSWSPFFAIKFWYILNYINAWSPFFATLILVYSIL